MDLGETKRREKEKWERNAVIGLAVASISCITAYLGACVVETQECIGYETVDESSCPYCYVTIELSFRI